VPDQVGTMAAAEFGKLLAADPNISIAPEIGQTSAPAPAAQAA
jgi:hypothetical protein